jgi:hypothetical protein
MTQYNRSNLKTSFKRRKRQGNPMVAYDVLPPELRHWLAHAALPWSTQSALRVWRKALKACNNDIAQSYAYLSRLEDKKLQKEADLIWGKTYPGLEQGVPHAAQQAVAERAIV